MNLLGRRFLLAGAAAAALPARAAPVWEALLGRARGQTVFFNAWGGDPRTNAFIAWAGSEVSRRHGVVVRQVLLGDTSEAVARVIAEMAAGRKEGGSVDLIWINGPNLLALEERHFLYGPVLAMLPHASLIDAAGKPATVVDFTVPVNGYAVPWRMAQIVYVYNRAHTEHPPLTIPDMLAWARSHPGRLTHPDVRNFLGVTFLKQALYDLAPERAVLFHPASAAAFSTATAPLWAWYDALRPHLWRAGRAWAPTGPAERSLMNDDEIDLMISFTPEEAALDIASGLLPPSVRAYVLKGGTIGNASFVAVPVNAAHKEGALVLANFLLSPAAQARAADPRVLGSPTVLALDRLDAADRTLFAAIPQLPGMLSAEELGRPLPEPHPSWMVRLADEFAHRYIR